MMRYVLLVGTAALCGCAGAGTPEIVSQTPASIEIRCVGDLIIPECGSPQAVADVADKHCAGFGLIAQQSQIRTSPSGNRWVTYICVAPNSAQRVAVPR
jgi:hypothetical protein